MKTEKEGGCIYCVHGNHEECERAPGFFCKCWQSWHDPDRSIRLVQLNHEYLTKE